jgi:hypothetical protein
VNRPMIAIWGEKCSCSISALELKVIGSGLKIVYLSLASSEARGCIVVVNLKGVMTGAAINVRRPKSVLIVPLWH